MKPVQVSITNLKKICDVMSTTVCPILVQKTHFPAHTSAACDLFARRARRAASRSRRAPPAGAGGGSQWDEAAAAVHPGRFSVLIPLKPPPMENCIFFDALRFSRSN
ncbi:unnamed protein product [Spodoptera exigua]|nr:unnamed protein product [Spodoptera exigua]